MKIAVVIQWFSIQVPKYNSKIGLPYPSVFEAKQSRLNSFSMEV